MMGVVKQPDSESEIPHLSLKHWTIKMYLAENGECIKVEKRFGQFPDESGDHRHRET